MRRRRRGRASSYSPSAGSAATLAQRPGPPQHPPARHGEAPGENPVGSSAGTAQVTQRGHHRRRPLSRLSPRGGHLSRTLQRTRRSLAPPLTQGPMRRAPSPHVGADASDQWAHAAEGGGRRAGRPCRTRLGHPLAPSLRRVSSGARPERGGTRCWLRSALPF